METNIIKYDEGRMDVGLTKKEFEDLKLSWDDESLKNTSISFGKSQSKWPDGAREFYRINGCDGL